MARKRTGVDEKQAEDSHRALASRGRVREGREGAPIEELGSMLIEMSA